MNYRDLAAVADVCARFRPGATLAARSKCKHLELHDISPVSTYAMIRNFGASIESACVSGYTRRTNISEAVYQKRLIEFLVRYCAEGFIKLELSSFDITDEIAILMSPLLGRVQRLHFENCKLDDRFLTNLPFWSPELRELVYSAGHRSNQQRNRLDFWHQKFPKLESIDFSYTKNVSDRDVEKLLMHHPQLKQIRFTLCENLSNYIIWCIVEFVPDIEKIHFKASNPECDIFYELGSLRRLKSLSINDAIDIPSVVQVFSFYKIHLEHLNLSHFDLRCDATVSMFTEGISNLPTLKSLRLETVKNLTATQLINICQPLKELSEIELCVIEPRITVIDLLELAQNVEKLRAFHYEFAAYESAWTTNVDIFTFNRLVEIVEARSEKSPLTLRLDAKCFTASIPQEHLRAASNWVRLKFSRA